MKKTIIAIALALLSVAPAVAETVAEYEAKRVSTYEDKYKGEGK